MAVKEFIHHVREDGGIVATFPSGMQVVVPPSGDIASMFSLGVSATVTREEACDFLGIEVPQSPNQAPTLTSLEPTTAEVGSADFELHVKGSGFTESSVIVFNGGDEPTTFVSDTEVTTTVKPSTASGPVTVPVAVRNGEGVAAPLDFTFTEAAAPEGGP